MRIPVWSMLACFVPSLLLAADAPDFQKDVLPIFRKHCQGCHNPKDAEGGLVLLDYASSIKGGESGKSIIGGQSDQSPLWKRIVATDDARMPPKEQAAISSAEAELIKRWIDSGAKASLQSVPGALMTPKIAVTKQSRQGISSIATSPDGRMTAISHPHSIDIVQGEKTHTITGFTGLVNEISFSRQGDLLCVAAGEIGLGGEATLWNTTDWTRKQLFQGHQDALYSAQMSPDGRILATASYDRDVMLWNVETGQPLKTLRGHNDAVYGLSFSSDSRFLASASGDRTIKLWDISTGQRLDTFSQPSKEQTTVAFSPDGRLLAAGGGDSRIRVWQISENGIEGTNPILYARFAHEGPILKVAFSTDGRLFASTSEDQRIKLWETQSWTQVAVLDRQEDWPAALAFAADNQQLIVGLMNGATIRVPVDPKWLNSEKQTKLLDETTHRSGRENPLIISQSDEIEPNNEIAKAMEISVPTIVCGRLATSAGETTDVDYYRFHANRGQKFVIETDAARSGSLADTKLDVLSADGRPVLRAVLQAVRDSWINFRPIDSSAADVRLEFWEEMDLNQYLYMSGEVCRTFRAPQGPDSGYQLYSTEGKRRNYFDTSASAHAKDEPVYVVEAFTPDSKIVENGLPVFPLYYSNDDDGNRRFGKDSRLIFTAPEAGTYFIRVADVRGFSGEKFTYKLTVRAPEPDFAVTVATMNPKIPAGSGQRLKFQLNRIDGFDGPVRIDLAGLPKGFQTSSPVMIQAGLLDTFSVMTADSDAVAPPPEDWERISVLATAEIDGKLVTRTVGNLGTPVLEKPAQIRVTLQPDDSRYTTEHHGLVIEPGTTITAKIVIERNGHDGDVRFDVDNLPHGIIVDNIGLSGVLVRKGENERQIFLTARPWVPETSRLIHAVAQSVGNQASPAIQLTVARRNTSVAQTK